MDEKKRKIFVLLSLLIIIFVFFGSSTAFLLQNNLLSWDLGGHKISSKNILENNLNPFPWDGLFFNGYPQNTFYPPLTSWVTATLGIFIPIDISFKIFILFFYLTLPFIIYKFSEIIFNNKLQQMILSFLLIALFFLPEFFYFPLGGGVGGTVYSTFEIGLIPAFIGIYFIISFIYLYEKNHSKIILGLVFGLGILSHYIFLSIIIFLIVDFFYNKDIKKFIYPQLIGFGISAFWWIPAIYFSEFALSGFFQTNLISFVSIIIILSFLSIIFFKVNNKSKKFFLFGIVLFLIVFFIERLGFQGQLFRILLIVVFFCSIPIFSLFTKLISKKELLTTATLILISIFILYFSINIDFSGSTSINIYTFPEIKGNSIIIGSTNYFQNQHSLFYHFADNKIAPLRGLFVEQSLNSIFISGIYSYVNSSAVGWGTQIFKSELIDSNSFETYKNIFAINSIIAVNDINSQIIYSKKEIIGEQKFFLRDKIFWFNSFEKYISSPITYYSIGENKKIDIINEDIQTYLGTDWKYFNKAYFKDFSNIVVNERINIEFEKNTNANIKNAQFQNGNIKFYIDSEKPVAAYIKESYFPRWKAYENGNEIHIYRASPNNMLIIGKGNIELKYEPTLIDNISLLISTIFICSIIIFVIKKYYLIKKIKI